MRNRILIIGSGAVGAVYGQHLVRAGCQVNFLVRDRHSPNSVMPRPLHRYRFIGKPVSGQQQLRVLTQAHRHWDQVWLTLPSDALYSDWLREQLSVFDAATPLISWTPDFRDHAHLQSLYRGPVQRGLIGLISFHTPLPGYSAPQGGFGYLLPPRSAMLDNSNAGRQAAALLRAGGLPSTVLNDLDWFAARSTALMISAIAALELANWSLHELARSPWLAEAGRAAREATAISAAFLGRRRSAPVPGPLLLRTLMALAPRVMPFDLQTYLHYHFSKVGEQTRLMLDHWLDEAGQHQLPAEGLRDLRDGLANLQKQGAPTAG